VARATADLNTNGTEIRAAISAWIRRLPAPGSMYRNKEIFAQKSSDSRGA